VERVAGRPPAPLCPATPRTAVHLRREQVVVEQATCLVRAVLRHELQTRRYTYGEIIIIIIIIAMTMFMVRHELQIPARFTKYLTIYHTIIVS